MADERLREKAYDAFYAATVRGHQCAVTTQGNVDGSLKEMIWLMRSSINVKQQIAGDEGVEDEEEQARERFKLDWPKFAPFVEAYSKRTIRK